MIEVNVEQREAIQELINIGFGKAMSALAEVLNTHVTLNVPVVEVVRPRRLAEILTQALGQDCTMTLVRQNFQGEFFGEAILSLPSETSRMLCSIL
ncbi:MAG: chemotaxis protein CheC, partial [Thermodesulfobacteriota bacterium]